MPTARRTRRRERYTLTLGDRLLILFALTVTGPLPIFVGFVAHLVWRWVGVGWGWT